MRPRSRKPVPTSPDLRGWGERKGRICFSPRSTLDKLPNSIIFLLRLGRVTCDHEEEANCGRATVAWALAVGDPILSLELGKGSIKLVAVLHVSAEMSAKVTVRHEAARGLDGLHDLFAELRELKVLFHVLLEATISGFK